jgi:hypothetical protein
VPKASECTNLLVPVCLSATHISYGSIRMEPVFMALGQSSATAAALAIDANIAVQKVDYARLRERLLADKQVLDWTGPRPTPPIDPKKLPGIVQDDEQAEKRGEWSKSNSIGDYIGTQYLHDNNEQKGELSVTFKLPLPKPGTYEVRLAYTANPNRATNVPVTIRHAKGEDSVTVNQKKAPASDKTFQSLGKFTFDKEAIIIVSNAKTDGYVIVDAVQVLPAETK